MPTIDKKSSKMKFDKFYVQLVKESHRDFRPVEDWAGNRNRLSASVNSKREKGPKM